MEGTAARNWIAFLRRMPSLIIGLFFFSAGAVTNFYAGLGMMPWGVLNVGIEMMTPLTLGQVSQVVGLVVLILGWLLGFPPGFGTFANMYFIGFFIDWIMAVGLLPIPSEFFSQFGMLLLSVGLLGLGSLLYLRVGLGAGPRDGLMMGLVKKTGRNVSTIRGAIEVTVLVLGYLLGGPVGIGTAISAVMVGPAVQLSFRLGGFDSKNTEQINVYELYRRLRGHGSMD